MCILLRTLFCFCWFFLKKTYPLDPSGYDEHSHGIDGPNRNRWFTELNRMVDLSNSQTVSHNQVGKEPHLRQVMPGHVRS